MARRRFGVLRHRPAPGARRGEGGEAGEAHSRDRGREAAWGRAARAPNGRLACRRRARGAAHNGHRAGRAPPPSSPARAWWGRWSSGAQRCPPPAAPLTRREGPGSPGGLPGESACQGGHSSGRRQQVRPWECSKLRLSSRLAKPCVRAACATAAPGAGLHGCELVPCRGVCRINLSRSAWGVL